MADPSTHRSSPPLPARELSWRPRPQEVHVLYSEKARAMLERFRDVSEESSLVGSDGSADAAAKKVVRFRTDSGVVFTT